MQTKRYNKLNPAPQIQKFMNQTDLHLKGNDEDWEAASSCSEQDDTELTQLPDYKYSTGVKCDL